MNKFYKALGVLFIQLQTLVFIINAAIHHRQWQPNTILSEVQGVLICMALSFFAAALLIKDEKQS